MVDHANDLIQTFIRPTAGAIVFAASANSTAEVSPVLGLIAGLLVAGTVHTVKSAAVRPLISASSASTADPLASFLEDLVAALVSVLSVVLPVLMAVIFILIVWWVVWFIRRRKGEKNPA